jgi:hypothetical protein
MLKLSILDANKMTKFWIILFGIVGGNILKNYKSEIRLVIKWY